MRIVIIGGGVVGLSTAYYARQRGFEVTVLERGAADRDGCSFGNAGMVTPSHFIPLAAPGVVALGLKWMASPESPFYIKPRLSWDLLAWAWKFWRAANALHLVRSAPLLRDLNLASRGCFEDLAGKMGNRFGLVKKGLIMLCKTDKALAEEAEIAAMARTLDMPAEVLNAKRAAELDGNVRMDIAGAVYYPMDCHVSPSHFMKGLQEQLESGEVAFAWNTEVRGWKTRGRRIEAVQTTRGDFVADEFVLCSGAWSPLVARGLGLRLPMQAGKGYSLTLSQPRQLPSICAIFTEARVAVTPLGSTLRFGGTMEIAGLNEEINPVRVRGIIKSVPRYYPEFRVEDFADAPVWRGLRPCSPDGLPYVGRVVRFENLLVATGHAMMGLSLGPITGKLISELLNGEKPSIDIGLLSPDRYGCA